MRTKAMRVRNRNFEALTVNHKNIQFKILIKDFSFNLPATGQHVRNLGMLSLHEISQNNVLYFRAKCETNTFMNYVALAFYDADKVKRMQTNRLYVNHSRDYFGFL